ncbi:MAG: hypothetical protein KKA65_04325 [Nanoarchaeota archaeon]|nr:hypothetical protein [Nanoarchaeota archaeon]
MGMIKEIFGDVEECPECHSKKIKAIVTQITHYFKDENQYWEDESQQMFNEPDIMFHCEECGEVFEFAEV